MKYMKVIKRRQMSIITLLFMFNIVNVMAQQSYSISQYFEINIEGLDDEVRSNFLKTKYIIEGIADIEYKNDDWYERVYVDYGGKGNIKPYQTIVGSGMQGDSFYGIITFNNIEEVFKGWKILELFSSDIINIISENYKSVVSIKNKDSILVVMAVHNKSIDFSTGKETGNYKVYLLIGIFDCNKE